jgi:hypothetical protein
LQVLPHDTKLDSVLVRYKLVRPRKEFAHSIIILSLQGGSRFLNLDTGQASPATPEKSPKAYLEHDSNSGWALRVEDAYNYHTDREKGLQLWQTMTAEQIAEPAGLAAAPPELKGFYALRQNDLPVTILIPQYGLLRVSGIDERTRSAILEYKRVTSASPTPADSSPKEPRNRPSVGRQARRDALDVTRPTESPEQRTPVESGRLGTEDQLQKLQAEARARDAELAQAKLAALREVEMNSNATNAARARLRQAESELAEVMKLHREKSASDQQLNDKKLAVALRAAELKVSEAEVGRIRAQKLACAGRSRTRAIS